MVSSRLTLYLEWFIHHQTLFPNHLKSAVFSFNLQWINTQSHPLVILSLAQSAWRTPQEGSTSIMLGGKDHATWFESHVSQTEPLLLTECSSFASISLSLLVMSLPLPSRMIPSLHHSPPQTQTMQNSTINSGEIFTQWRTPMMQKKGYSFQNRHFAPMENLILCK